MSKSEDRYVYSENRGGGGATEEQAGGLGSMDLPTMVLEIARLVWLPDDGVASLKLAESARDSI